MCRQSLRKHVETELLLKTRRYSGEGCHKGSSCERPTIASQDEMKSSVGEVSAAQLGLAAQAIARLVARIMRCVIFSFAPPYS